MSDATAVVPPPPAPDDASAETAPSGTPEAPDVHHTTVPGLETAPAAATADEGYQLSMPQAELERVMADAVGKAVGPLQDKITKLEAARDAALATQPLASAAEPQYDPVFAANARVVLGDHAPDALVERYAHTADVRAQWHRLLGHAEHGGTARGRISQCDAIMDQARFHAEFVADKAERAAQAKAAEKQTAKGGGELDDLPATVGEVISAYRINLANPDNIQNYPAVQAAMRAGQLTSNQILDTLQLHKCPTVKDAETALWNYLTNVNNFLASQPAPSADATGAENPGALSPNQPSAAGHTGRGHARSQKEWEAAAYGAN